MTKKVCMAVTNPFTHDQRVYREAKSLVDDGYDVTVVALKEDTLKIPGNEEIDGIKVLRISKKPAETADGLNFLMKRFGDLPSVLFYGNTFTPLFKKILIGQKADIYHAHDLDTLAASFEAAKVSRAKVVYDSHEIFLEALKEWQTEIRNKRDYLKWLGTFLVTFNLARIERKLIGKVDKVITVNESISDFLAKKYSLLEKPVVILNCYEETNIRNENILRKKLRVEENKKIIIFQGNFGWVRGLDNAIKAMKKVDGAVLVLMGGGGIKGELEELVKKLQLGNKIFFLDAVPPKDLIVYTSSADLGIIPYRKTSLNNFLCTPNKIFEYMMAGIPMAVSNFPELARYANLGIGETFDPENPDSIARAVNKLLSSDLGKMKKKARNLALERYNWGVESKKLLDLYSSLV